MNPYLHSIQQSTNYKRVINNGSMIKVGKSRQIKAERASHSRQSTENRNEAIAVWIAAVIGVIAIIYIILRINYIY
jgi:hypothetical protein